MLTQSLKPKGMFKDNVDFAKLDDSLNDTDYVYGNCENILEENLLPSVTLIARNLQIKVLEDLKTAVYQEYFIMQNLTLNFGLQPMGFAREAWNVLKLISAYAARKKLEISGAMAFSSPATQSMCMTK
jgi:hypothetical protein